MVYTITYDCTWSARACFGVMKTQRELGEEANIRRIANSAQMVLPLPVGAPTKTSSSVLYRSLNTAKERERESVCVRERGRGVEEERDKRKEGREEVHRYTFVHMICITLYT